MNRQREIIVTVTYNEFGIILDAKAEPRKTGMWKPFDLPWYQCSECGAVRENKTFMENFCPNCGAKMEGDSDEDDKQ